ncbi:hypothetical protein [Curtobacterium sp. MCSS17_016]|uniref:hypothetical protein n=1 Tax=Curtobacterium sp. MCSS17_016 TaxID=2175644 RepID=UPI000DAABCD5|nr:hypothetical protein [Curtobacterium sp. MCSS17_016]WIE81074.1 hypothetical protein DEJ19_021520 [Curtobacterium sp. MCSS17_016]
MSRTRKDRPYWVVRNKRQYHRGDDHSWWQHHRAECDIDQQARPGGRGLPRCSHLLAWSAGSVAQRNEVHRCRVGKLRRRTELWKPDRTATRDALDKATGDWNTAGTIDEDAVPLRQTRRGPYTGGYWD